MTWWLRSLLVGGVALVVTAGVALWLGCCGPGVSLLAGAVAGWWCATGGAPGNQGAFAGALAGGLALIGQLLGGLLTMALLPALADTTPGEYVAAYAVGALLSSLILGLLGLVLATLAGATAAEAYRRCQ